jgi:hypothetical protein
MMRAFILALALVTVVTAPAHARGPHADGRRDHFARNPRPHVGAFASPRFEGHHDRRPVAHPRFRHVPHHGYVPGYGYYVPGFSYAPNCWWQEGYWIDQPYVDRYGAVIYVPQRVPGQWVCP